MSKANKTDKLNSALINDNEGEELSETSFITNIKIDVSASPDNVLHKEKKSNTPEDSLKSLTQNNLLSSRSSARTTTLALDPRPYKKRERVYTTIIIILTVALVTQSGLLWMMHLQSVSKETNKFSTQNQITLSGVSLNQTQLYSLADIFMREQIGKSFIVSFKSEREALADFIQGRIQLIQITEPLSTEEKKYVENVKGSSVQEIQHKTFFVGLFINEANPINELTLEQLKGIFLGKITNWSNLGGENAPIIIGKHKNNSAIDKVFQQKLMNKPGEIIDFEMFKDFSGFEPIVSMISYGEFKGVLPPKTKLLKIKLKEDELSVEPILQGTVNERYPFTYNTYLYGIGLSKEELDIITKGVKKEN